MQDFYVKKKKDRIWSFTETKALELYLFQAGRRRTSPPSEEWVWRTLERWLMNHSRDVKIATPKQAHAAARRALADGIRKLLERSQALRQADVSPSNNLAGIGLDDVVIELLLKGGFRTKALVARATNDQLKAVRGIDRARLRQIRAFIPHVSAKTARKQALATNGQGQLF